LSICLLIQNDSISLRVASTPLAAPMPLDETAVTLLHQIAEAYRRLERRADRKHALQLGHRLYRWMDAADARLARAIEQAGAPLLFEVHCPSREPSAAEWAVLHAPWEMLADQHGHLAAEPLLSFAPYRRLGPRRTPLAPDDYRLGLCFMAASPADQPELDFEAEEQAILTAVGSTALDLVVEESGAASTLGQTLRDSGDLPVLHLSCHGHSAWRENQNQPERPVLMLEDGAFGSSPTDAPTLLRALQPRALRLLFLSACLSAHAPTADSASAPRPAGELPPAPEHKAPDASAAGAQGASATAAAPVHSLATALLRAGLPAVLGWDGSVADQAATRFAATLYRSLAEQTGLALAVAAARAALLDEAQGGPWPDWHLARLWLGDRGEAEQPFVQGRRKRSLLPANYMQKDLLAKDVPVAAHGYFVGRRRELQRALAALSGADSIGVLITGMGRLGKSSLAARIVNRLRDQRSVAVVHGRFGIALLLERLTRTLEDQPAAAQLLAQQSAAVQQALPEGDAAALPAFRQLLLNLLGGPCQQRTDAGKPLLLVLDDFEQLLVDGAAPRPVDAKHAGLVRLLLEVFEPTRSDSRLLITSRYPFTLSSSPASLASGLASVPASGAGDDPATRLHPIALGSFRPTEQDKLLLRQRGAAEQSASERPGRFTDLAEREALLEGAKRAARGNPGLMDLIGAGLVLNPNVPLAAAEAALRDMETHLTGGPLPTDERLRTLLEQIAVDKLLALAGDSGQELVRALTLVEQPLPFQVIQAIAEQLGGDPEHLAALGLLEPGLAPVRSLNDPARPSRRVNPLAAGRLSSLTEAERQTVAALTLAPLHSAWTADGSWPDDVDLALCRLAVLVAGPAAEPAVEPAADQMAVVEHARTVAETVAQHQGANAIGALARDSYQDAAQLARQVNALLQRAARPPTRRFSAAAVRVLADAGHVDEADAILADADPGGDPDGDEDWVGTLQIAQQRGERLHRKGDLNGAMAAFEEGLDLAQLNDHAQGVAVLSGKIADLLMARGQLDEALRIRTEEELPVFQRLGDVREMAVTQGQIADLLMARGQLDEALRIRTEEQLPVFQRLGAVRDMAVTQGRIADILMARGQLDEALRIRTEEELPVFQRLGAVREMAVTQGQIADLLMARGQLDEALRIRTEEQLPVFQRLGAVREMAVTQGQIADILMARGQLDEALRIRTEEQLPVYQRLGAVREMAVTQGDIADLLMARGQLDEALRIRTEEQLPVFQRLGAVREMAVTQGQIADLLMARGQLDEALRIRTEEELPVFQRLGDVREMAVTQSKIADILMDRGQLDEALRIRTEEELPVFQRLGAVREMAVTQGKIADLLMARGQLDEALRIRTEEQLPVFQRLGAVRDLLVCRANIAVALLMRMNQTKDQTDRTQANQLLCVALADARRLRLPEADQIEQILQQAGMDCSGTDALP
jgi:tetratricopeptide (TPR) repeat protein